MPFSPVDRIGQAIHLQLITDGAHDLLALASAQARTGLPSAPDEHHGATGTE